MDEFVIGNIMNDSISKIYLSEERSNIMENVNKKYIKHCSTLCKPHEINKQMGQLDEYIKNSNYKKIVKWRNDLLKIGTLENYHSGNLNAFEA